MVETGYPPLEELADSLRDLAEVVEVEGDESVCVTATRARPGVDPYSVSGNLPPEGFGWEHLSHMRLTIRDLFHIEEKTLGVEHVRYQGGK